MIKMIGLGRLSSSSGAWRTANGASMPSTTRTASSAARCNASILDPVVAEAARVSLAARTLSQLERDVLALSAGRGLSIRQIALLLGIGERRAERLLAKALGKFDRALERQGGARLQF